MHGAFRAAFVALCFASVSLPGLGPAGDVRSWERRNWLFVKQDRPQHREGAFVPFSRMTERSRKEARCGTADL
jgi:hypothetical protein